MFILNEFPSVNVSAGFESRWNAVHQPIIYKGTRRDAAVLNIAVTMFGSIQANRITLTAIPPSDFTIGSQLTVVSGGKVNTVKILSISGNHVFTTRAFMFPTVGGLANTSNRKNYYVQTKIWGVDQNNTYFEVGLMDTKPLANGVVQLNVNGFLKTITEFTDIFQYNQINKKIARSGGRFVIQTREVWKNYEGAFSAFSENNAFFWVNGAKQIKESFNFNMGVWVPFQNYFPKVANFISAFEKPTYFDGYPFSLTFIYSEKLAGRQIARVEDRFNLNGSVVSNATNNLITDQNSSINRLMIAGGYSSNIVESDVWLEDVGVGVINIFAGGYVAPGYGKTYPELKPIKL